MTARRLNTGSYKSKRSEVTTTTDKSAETVDEYDRPFQCHIHSQTYLNLYCGFCKKPICERCKETAHARHCTDIKGQGALIRAAKHRRTCIQKLANTRENRVIPRIKSLIVEISECKAKLQSRVENIIKRYQNYVKIHREKLIVTEDVWIEEFVFRADKYHISMDEKIMFLHEQLSEAEATFHHIQKELNSACHAELLLIFNALRTRLEFLHEPKWPRDEVFVTMKLETVPQFGSIMFQTDTAEKNCTVSFDHQIVEPLVYSRIYDMRLPIQKKALKDESAKFSLTSATNMYASFGEYIVTYTLDSRRSKRASNNINFTSIMSVRESIIDISCDQHETLFYLTQKSVNTITKKKKTLTCFSVVETPSALCVTRDGHKHIFVAFHDAGNIFKYDEHGKILMELSHPDPRMAYRPRHLTMNYIGDIFFSDDISNVTILDENGIWKGAISRDVHASFACGPIRPAGIACSFQRHIFLIDNNTITNIHIFNEDGKYLQTAVYRNLKDAYVLNIDRTGDVWIAFKDGRVRIYRPSFIYDFDRA